jgi:hypothetical protein
MEREYRERLTPAERAHYRVTRIADRAGLYRAADRARRALGR